MKTIKDLTKVLNWSIYKVRKVKEAIELSYDGIPKYAIWGTGSEKNYSVKSFLQVEKINIIANNLEKFSFFDKKNRARLTMEMHPHEKSLCNYNSYVFHIADRVGVFSSPFGMSQKTRQSAIELGLI